MANFGPLKAEMARIARRSLHAEIQSLRKASADHRRAIADLRRTFAKLGKRNQRLERAVTWTPKGAAPTEDHQRRFSPKGLVSLRSRIGTSAEDFGRLIGVTGQSVLNWEAGKSSPRAAAAAKIVSVRSIGKREATARLEALREKGVRAGGRAAKKSKAA